MLLLSLASLTAVAGNVGKPAPALAAKLFDGNDWSLAQQQGHVVLVNYWASWCGPCKQELPVFVSYYQAHHAEGFELLAINVDDPDTLDTARAMAKAYPFAVTRAADIRTDDYARGCQPSKGLVSLFSFCRLPHTYLIDRNGNLQLDVVDGFDEARLDKTVGPLLGTNTH
jgi:thiol-disulfide isomerase/thioredoxin